MRYLSRKIITMRGLAVLTSIMVCMTSLLFSSKLEAVAQDNPLDKLDKIISGMVEQNDREEVISTAVWFTDIDYDEVYDAERSILSSYIESGEMPYEIMDLLEENEKFLSNNLPLECVQQAVHIERLIAKEKYSIQNSQFFYDVLPEYDGNIYISHYAPCVLAELSVDEILSLADSDVVQSLMYCDDQEENERSYDFTDDIDGTRETPSLVVSIDDCKDVIGITDAQGYVDTSGIVIGILEDDGIPDMSYAVLTPINTSGRYHIIPATGSTSSHATGISALLAGKTAAGFEGVAYDATYYYTYDQYYQSYSTNDQRRMAAAEDLIDHDVNIISRSVSVGGFENDYGVFSQYYDHISTCHHVHFCIAVGNIGSDGNPNVCNSNMGYNVITVGSMAYDGDEYYYKTGSSCYSNSTIRPYKPDVCAPYKFMIPLTVPTEFGGSSMATPVTAGALAYILASYSAVVWSPAIGKAAICSGSKEVTHDSVANLNDSGQIAMNRCSGVGLLNISSAVKTFDNFDTNYYSFGLCLSGYSLNFNKSITVSNADVAAHKRLNLCICYNVRNTYATGVSHITNNATIGTFYPIYMTVTAPNSTVYRANYAYTNMEVISFVPLVAGTYSVHADFAITGTTFSDDTRFGFMANIVS